MTMSTQESYVNKYLTLLLVCVLCVNVEAQSSPTNDDCSGAILIDLTNVTPSQQSIYNIAGQQTVEVGTTYMNFFISDSIYYATASTFSQTGCYATAADLWYRFSAPVGTSVTFDTCSSVPVPFDTTLCSFSSCACSTMSVVSSADDNGVSNCASSQTQRSSYISGTFSSGCITVRVAAYSLNVPPGQFTLRVRVPCPSNVCWQSDFGTPGVFPNFSSAGVSSSVSVSSSVRVSSSGTSIPSGGGGGGGGDVNNSSASMSTSTIIVVCLVSFFGVATLLVISIYASRRHPCMQNGARANNVVAMSALKPVPQIQQPMRPVQIQPIQPPMQIQPIQPPMQPQPIPTPYNGPQYNGQPYNNNRLQYNNMPQYSNTSQQYNNNGGTLVPPTYGQQPLSYQRPSAYNPEAEGVSPAYNPADAPPAYNAEMQNMYAQEGQPLGTSGGAVG